MTGMKSTNKRIPLVMSLIAMMIVMGMQLVFAAAGVSMPDLKSDSSTLTVRTQYTDEAETTLIGGMELSAYKVADVTVKSGIVTYTATRDFASVDIDYNNLTTESSIAAAESLYKLVGENGIKGSKAVSDGNGSASFGQVDNGMYLIAQTGASGMAEDYSTLKPYLVMAPQPLTDIGENDWEYDVVSMPKMAVESEMITITKKVESQDNVAVEKRTDKFAYDIVTEVGYEPEGFAIIDNVPEELEIVDMDRIVIKVNGTKLSDEEKNQILTITGNTLRVAPSQEQIAAWNPFDMSIMFYCKFRDDAELEEGQSVVNKAGYEVKGVYYEPPGDDHHATVKSVFDIDEKDKDSKDKDKNKTQVKSASTNTGDDIRIFVALIIAVAASALIIALIVKRRRSDRDA